MNFRVKFSEQSAGFVVKFGEVHNISDGGYERGYAAGYEDGKVDGSSILSTVISGNSVETLEDDNVTFVKQYGLANDTTLKVVRFKNMTSGGTSCFQNSTALETVDLPSLKRVPYTGFSGCTALKNVNIPIATLDYASFNNCKSLERLDLNANVDYINALSFANCEKLVTLILRCFKKVATLNNKNALNGTPVANGTGYIYVPDTLVEQYKAASNWSTYASQIKPISELEE